MSHSQQQQRSQTASPNQDSQLLPVTSQTPNSQTTNQKSVRVFFFHNHERTPLSYIGPMVVYYGLQVTTGFPVTSRLRLFVTYRVRTTEFIASSSSSSSSSLLRIRIMYINEEVVVAVVWMEIVRRAATCRFSVLDYVEAQCR